MKFIKLNLWPLSLIFTSDKQGGGRAYFWLVLLPIIVLRPKYEKHLLEHELFHARQYFLTLLIPYFILNATKWGQFRLEAAAYGHAKRSVEIEKRSEYLHERAEYLASNAYSHGRNAEECRAQILKKFLDGGLL